MFGGIILEKGRARSLQARAAELAWRDGLAGFHGQTGRKEGKGRVDDMSKLEELVNMAKINELLGKKEEEKKKDNTVLWVFAVIGAIAAIAGIAYAVYRYLTPDYLEDFEDDFEDEFDEDEDEFFEDEEEKPAAKKEEKADESAEEE